jgi:hypothetical protein
MVMQKVVGFLNNKYLIATMVGLFLLGFVMRVKKR